jgi:ComF family protein
VPERVRDPPAFDASVTLADYAAPIDGLVIALKFGHRLEVAHTLGLLLGRLIDRSAPADAVLAVVPLAFERQRERGFNQALEIARATARASGRRLLPHALLRVRHRPAQEGLTLDERRRNVRGAFAVARTSEPGIAGRTLVMVDDVLTSGSTLDEAARVLKRAGAAAVINAVAARTP